MKISRGVGCSRVQRLEFDRHAAYLVVRRERCGDVPATARNHEAQFVPIVLAVGNHFATRLSFMFAMTRKRFEVCAPTFYPTFYPTAMRALSEFIARRKVHIG